MMKYSEKKLKKNENYIMKIKNIIIYEINNIKNDIIKK